MKKPNAHQDYIFRIAANQPSRLRRRVGKGAKKYEPSPPAEHLVEFRTERSYTKAFHLLRNNGFLDKELATNYIKVPEKLSFKDAYAETFQFLREYTSSLYYIDGKVEIDFVGCQHLDLGPLLLVKVIRTDHYKYLVKRYRALPSAEQVVAEPKYSESDTYAVNRILFTLGFITKWKPREEDKSLELSTVGFISERKSRKSYVENKKGPVCKRIRRYINSCVRKVGFQLSANGETAIDQLLSEVLNNTEDHTITDEWHVAGVSLHETTDAQDAVCEVRLVIMNLGFSIFEGFEGTKHENYQVYDLMQEVYDRATAGLSDKDRELYNKPNLFTLYALQEGISRLKYQPENSSRGNGTMNFIRAFLDLGDYEVPTRNHGPTMSILSGKTMVLCDGTYKPYKVDTVYQLSLNPEKDLTVLPDPRHLWTVPDNFPGTLLETRLFFNKDHFLQKYDRATANEVH